MRIQLLLTQECPHAALARDRLREGVERLAPGTPIEEIDVSTAAQAGELGFVGSPSVRIDGVDLELRTDTSAGLACRRYGAEGAPPIWLIEAALLRARAPRHVLFMCVANSARSQLADGLARTLAPSGVRISSAGSEPTSVRADARRALEEIGISAAELTSKGTDAVDVGSVEAVVTLCDDEVCPVLPGPAARVHWALPDPASVQGDAQARLEAFRAVRNQLAPRIAALFGHDAESVRRRHHWATVYGQRRPDEVSWYQATLATALDRIAACGITADASIIDVGGGAATLVDSLLDRGHRALTVLDISAAALQASQIRLGSRAGSVRWVTADLLDSNVELDGPYDLWHDRAVFHFLVEPDDRARYITRLVSAVRPGGHVLLATFADDGPTRCSGLPVVRYSPESLMRTVRQTSDQLELVDARRETHTTPAGRAQRFLCATLRRRSAREHC